jgi:hypothetical protein
VISLAARMGDERSPVLADPFIEAREFLSLDRCRITATKVARWRVPDAIRLPLAKIVFGAAHIVFAGRPDIPRCNHRTVSTSETDSMGCFERMELDSKSPNSR